MLKDIETELQQFRTSEQYVRISVVAAHFGISKWTIYRLAETGKIPSYKIGGKRRFKLSELEAAFRANA